MNGNNIGPSYGIDSYGKHTTGIVASHASRDAHRHSHDSSESKQVIITKDIHDAVEYDSSTVDKGVDSKTIGRVV